jgi:hypothetical protein
MKKLKPGPTTPPVNGKYYTVRDLPLTVVSQCGCYITTTHASGKEEIAEFIEDETAEYCHWCEEIDEVRAEEKKYGLKPLLNAAELDHKEYIRTSYERVGTYRDWYVSTEQEIDSGVRPAFNAKIFEILQAIPKKDRWRNAVNWIVSYNEQGHYLCSWNELQMVRHIVQESLKDRRAFFCLVANPSDTYAGHVKEASRRHIQDLQDCLALIASPSKEIRAMGIQMAAMLNKKKPCQEMTRKIGEAQPHR